MKTPHKIVILGGGTAGWITANLMAHHWNDKGVKICVVESSDIGTIGVGEGSTPTIRRFFETIGVSEQDWMAKCNATYKVNIRFEGWSPKGAPSGYSHPFITQLDTFTERPFLVNCMTRRLGLDVETTPDKFLFNAILAHQNKIPISPESFPFNIEYGYHFDSNLLGKFLAEYAVSKGVEHISAQVKSADLTPSGDIDYLHTLDGNNISADFFIDCSGFESILLQKTLGVKFNSYKSNLFNDSAVVLPTPAPVTSTVETVSTAMSAGWRWQIPLTNRMGNGYVYSSDYISTDEAEHELRQELGLLDSPINARHLKMKVGQVERHWQKNCLALGLSQGFIEPLEATALHLVQASVEMFINDYEEGNFSNKHIERYNYKVNERFESVRDYIVAHYKLNTRSDSQYWQDNSQNTKLSDSLLQLLDTWYRKEDLHKMIKQAKGQSGFSSLSWHCLLAGYGDFPSLAPNQPNTGDLYKEANVEVFLNRCSLNFKTDF